MGDQETRADKILVLIRIAEKIMRENIVCFNIKNINGRK